MSAFGERSKVSVIREEGSRREGWLRAEDAAGASTGRAA